jgi:hypothetical protein
MQAYDTQILAGQLNALCEVYDKKPVSLKGVEVWFDVLKEFPTERVMSLLIAWPKTHTKFPAPAEVWKSVNEMNITQREQQAERERKEPVFYPGVGGAKAEEFIASIRRTLKSPKWSPEEHWRRNLERFEVESIGHRYAVDALKKKGILKEPQEPEEEYMREPGQDDEEREAVNF